MKAPVRNRAPVLGGEHHLANNFVRSDLRGSRAGLTAWIWHLVLIALVAGQIDTAIDEAAKRGKTNTALAAMEAQRRAPPGG